MIENLIKASYTFKDVCIKYIKFNYIRKFKREVSINREIK